MYAYYISKCPLHAPRTCGNGCTLTMAEVMIPRQPSLPSTCCCLQQTEGKVWSLVVIGRDRLFVADLHHVIKNNSFGNCWNALKCKRTQKNVAKIGEIEAECHCWKTDVCRGSTNCRFSLSLGVTMALPNSTARSDEAHLDQARQHVEWNPIPISYNII